MAFMRPGRERSPRSRGFLAKLLTLVAIVAAAVFGVTVFFQVNTFEIHGVENYSEDAVIIASGIELGQSILLVDKSKVASQINTRLPYVQSVQIERRLPGTVVITVTEGKAAASVRSEYDEYWLIDDKGKLMEQVNEDRAASVTQISGVSALLPVAGDQIRLSQEDQQRLDVALELLQQLERYDLAGQIVSIDVTQLYNIVMYYTDQFEIQLGSTEELDYKIKYLAYALESLDGKSGLIDLTFDQDRIARFLPW